MARLRGGGRAHAVIVAGLLLALVAVACGRTGVADDGRASVVASAYPLAEAAERVGGDLVRVRNLTPPGVEPHDLELAPDDLEAVLTADLVLAIGGGFQPAVEDALADGEGTILVALEVASPIGGPAAEEDPHAWLDPMRLAQIVVAIADTLAEVDPPNAATYRANAQAYVLELGALDKEMREGLASCRSRLLVVNHAAFGYLAVAYGLEQEAIAGIAPETEPNPARLAELEELVRTEGVTTVFTETLVPDDVARTLAEEAGVSTAILDPIESLTQAQLDAGEDYGSIMRSNLQTLRSALGCA